jgi:hypothetical protein
VKQIEEKYESYRKERKGRKDFYCYALRSLRPLRCKAPHIYHSEIIKIPAPSPKPPRFYPKHQ